MIGQGVSGGGAEGALASQLREKETLLTAWLQDREEHSATMCLEVTKLTTALQDYQVMVQVSVIENMKVLFHLSIYSVSIYRDRGEEAMYVIDGTFFYISTCAIITHFFQCLHNSGHFQ